LDGVAAYEVCDLSSDERKTFLKALMLRQKEQFDSDADHADIP